MNHFSILLWHVTKSGFFFMTTGDDQLSGWTQKKLQSTSQKQTWTTEKGHDNSLVVYCWSDPCQLSESWGNYCIWAQQIERCTKTATPAASIGQQKGRNFSSQLQTIYHTTNASKVEQNGLQSFTSSSISPDLSPTSYHFFKHLDDFLQENASTASRRQTMLSKSSLNPKAWIFMLQEWSNLFLVGKNMLIVTLSIVIFPILINKDVFEPSYND